MYQQFTYEEARHHDAYRAAHASDPTWSDFRRRRPIRRWFVALRKRFRRDVIDLRSPVPGMPTVRQHVQTGPGVLPEFIDTIDTIDITASAPTRLATAEAAAQS